MDPIKEERNDELSIHELIIMLVRDEPIMYDKSIQSKKNIKDLRKEVINMISQSIYHNFQVNLTVNEIQNKWNYILSKYLEERKKENAYIRSGSGTEAVYKSTWPLYYQMDFLRGHFDQRRLISSISIEEDSGNEEELHNHNAAKNNEKKKKKKTNNDEDFLKEISAKVDACKNLFATKKEQSSINIYVSLIRKGFDKVDEENKFSCTAEILAFIEKFKQT